MGNLANIPQTDHIGSEDYIVVIQDGCARKLPYKEFIKNVVLGGSSICEAWLDCIEGIGCVDQEVPVIDIPPTIGNLVFNIPNRKKDNKITMQDFLETYFDNDGDALARVEIAGGDTSGYTLNGSPVNIGDIFKGADILNYDSKNQGVASQSILYFRAYDENNIEAN